SLGKFKGTTQQSLTLPTKDQYALLHFSTYDTEKFVMRYLSYAKVEAEVKFSTGQKFSLTRTVAAMDRYIWIFRRALLLGPRLGVIIMLNFAFSRLMTYSRLYDLENGITIERIEENYNQLKAEVLQDLNHD